MTTATTTTTQGEITASAYAPACILSCDVVCVGARTLALGRESPAPKVRGWGPDPAKITSKRAKNCPSLRKG
eukprot:295099-Karenia_brevis.AAC.1